MKGAFSCYHVPSHLRGGYVDVPNLSMDKLVTWVHTTPLVSSFEMNSPVIDYRAEGKEARCVISMTVTFADDARSLWDISDGAEGKGDEFAHEAKVACAAAWGASLRFFTLQSFESNWTELKNRGAAQAILYDGRDVNSSSLQWKIRANLADHPLQISQLSSLTGQSYELVRLACLRMYLAGEVLIPLESQLLSSSWMVRRATRAAELRSS